MTTREEALAEVVDAARTLVRVAREQHGADCGSYCPWALGESLQRLDALDAEEDDPIDVEDDDHIGEPAGLFPWRWRPDGEYWASAHVEAHGDGVYTVLTVEGHPVFLTPAAALDLGSRLIQWGEQQEGLAEPELRQDITPEQVREALRKGSEDMPREANARAFLRHERVEYWSHWCYDQGRTVTIQAPGTRCLFCDLERPAGLEVEEETPFGPVGPALGGAKGILKDPYVAPSTRTVRVLVADPECEECSGDGDGLYMIPSDDGGTWDIPVLCPSCVRAVDITVQEGEQ